MHNIAVIGDKDSIYGFAAVGLATFAVETKHEAAEKINELRSGSFAVIYITEWLAEELSDLLSKLDGEQIPAIVPIPGISGNTGIGIARVKQSVEKAVGSDIIFNN
ncbi:MAG: V-type ATP synthase subunit F [Oscillospiraceae bacterium]|jgi:V/A-type H+-transporting ATPase subunit F|nr:V-type ATP synthase subunit F [Oscillospiraceae bacterium]